MNNLLEHVAHSIHSRQLFRRGQSILVAVSGGVDSMVLLQVLHRLSAANDWKLVVAHFNHQLRGAESDADEELVRNTAARLGWRFISERGDVRGQKQAGKLSLEMAARELRHGFLGSTAARLKVPTVALAHHADDQVELFFLRLFRGAGGEGLSGMKWIGPAPFHPRVQLARPLLDQTKSGLLAYAQAERIPFREDASNASLDFLRNRIRQELLPLLAKQYQPSICQTILRSMDIISAEADYAEQAARRWLDNKRRSRFQGLPPAIQRQCLRLQLLGLGVSPEFARIEQLRLKPNQPIPVAQGCTLSRDEAGQVREIVRAEFNPNETSLDLDGQPAEDIFDCVTVRWKFDSASGKLPHPAPRAGCEYFDAVKVGPRITLRHWRKGDRFQPIGMKPEVKLQDLFTNLKVPRAQRRVLTVAATASGSIFWVEGLRIGERFKLDKDTRRRLKWEWRRLAQPPVATR